MKLYLKYLAGLLKNPWFYFCETLALIALFCSAPLVALMYGLIVPLAGATIAFLENEFGYNLN